MAPSWANVDAAGHKLASSYGTFVRSRRKHPSRKTQPSRPMLRKWNLA